MTDIKITQQMIDYYRNKPGNLLLLDSAIIELIQKDIDAGNFSKEFEQLANDAQKKGYDAVNSNLFGYGFDAMEITDSKNVEFKYEIKDDDTELKTNNEYKGLFDSDKKVSTIMQSCVGDCVLLSELISLSNNTKAKKYIENAISYDENGNIEVYFIGVDKTITVPRKHLYNPIGVLGDIDASAIEKAVWLYIKEQQNKLSFKEYDILDPKFNVSQPYTFAEKLSNGFYPEINAFSPGFLTFLLTGADSYEEFENIDGFLENVEKNNYNDFILTLNLIQPVGGKKWYTDIKELVGGYFGGLVSAHSFSINDINSDDIVLINPWFSGKKNSHKINDINSKYEYFIGSTNTNDFLKKEEDGNTVILKRQDGSIARITEKNDKGQLTKIQKFDKDGRITACQEYKNGEKVQLTKYYDLTEDYKLEKEGELDPDWRELTESKTIYYFENNRYKMHSVILIISEIENNKVNQNLTTINHRIYFNTLYKKLNDQLLKKQ